MRELKQLLSELDSNMISVQTQKEEQYEEMKDLMQIINGYSLMAAEKRRREKMEKPKITIKRIKRKSVVVESE